MLYALASTHADSSLPFCIGPMQPVPCWAPVPSRLPHCCCSTTCHPPPCPASLCPAKGAAADARAKAGELADATRERAAAAGEAAKEYGEAAKEKVRLPPCLALSIVAQYLSRHRACEGGCHLGSFLIQQNLLRAGQVSTLRGATSHARLLLACGSRRPLTWRTRWVAA